MTKISKKSAYPLKSPIKDDYFVGSDSEILGKTVNFSFEDATKIVNELNGTSVLNYRFKTDYNINLEVLNEGVFLSLGNVTSINSITKLYINKKNLGETDLSQLFQFIATNKEQFLIKLRNSTNPNNAVYLNITALNNFTDYFTIDVSVYLSNASITSLVHYNTYFFEFELKAGSGSGSQGPQGEPGINGTNGTNGTNGLSAYQIAINNATFVGTEAEFAAMQATVIGKLDKGTYSGDANALDTRISQLEGSQVFYNRFTGKSYAIWSGTGLIYDVYYTSYYINNVLYAGGYIQKTLSASDPTNPRFDLIKVDSTGVIVATGTPSASPEVPTADPNTELAISPVLVDAGATTPIGAVNEDVYKENAEWTTVSNNGTVNFNATTIPFQGTKYIDCGAFTNGQYLRFTDSAVNQITDFSLLKFYVNLKATFSTSAKFSVKFYNGTTLVSSVLTVTSGSYNFDRTIINTYQALIIPLSSFTFSSSSFNRIEIVMVGSNTSGFRIDNVILSQGAGTSSTEQKAIATITTDSGIANATIKDDTFQFKGANGLIVSALGKTITFTPNITTILKSNYDSAFTWISTNGANILSHLSNTSNPHSVTKSQIGLGNVDNTSDVNKPISTATQTALNAKLSGTLTTNRIPKANGSGVLSDSALIQVGGNLGLGSAVVPGELFHIGDGNILLEGGGEVAQKFKRDFSTTGENLGVPTGSGVSVNPIFQIGRIIQAGDGDPEIRIMYSDDNTTERTVFEVDRKGIVASVKTAIGSHYEGFASLTDVNPMFRLNSYPRMRLEMGAGGNNVTDVAVERGASGELAFFTNSTKRGEFDSSGNLSIITVPTTSASGYDILTRNTSTGKVEKIASSGLGGDMLLGTAQIVSALKTFLNGTLGLRNVANTFTSLFTNTNTAARTYTLPDKSMTVAGTDDIAIVPLNEGNGIGYVIGGRNAANYGSVGLGAVDLGYSTGASSTRGATYNYCTVSGGSNNTASSTNCTVGGGLGNNAVDQYCTVSGGLNNTASNQFAFVGGGFNNTASAQKSTIVGGDTNTASGQNTFIGSGVANIASGYSSSVLGGEQCKARSYGESVVGINPTDYTPTSATTWSATDRIFNVGNGASTASYSNAFTILKNGLATLPSVTNALIIADSTGKAVTTREYVDSKRVQRLAQYTVSTLPTGVQGDNAYVTDALAPTYMATVVGGGSVVTPVFYNGSSWIAH
jgi:hypothetical protein